MSISIVCCEPRLKGQVALSCYYLGTASWASAQAVVEVGSCNPPSNIFTGGRGQEGSLMLAFTLSLVFRINGKESNLIFPLKIFPNIYDPRYIFPHLLLKRIWDCSYHKVISSETVKNFKRGSHISGNHIHGRGNLLLSAVLLGWIRLVYPAGGIPSVPGKALSPHWVDCLGRPQFFQARGALTGSIELSSMYFFGRMS